MITRLILPITAIIFAGAALITAAMPVQQKTVFTTERAFTVEALTAEADAIVLGHFTTARTYADYSTGATEVLTDWQFVVDEVWKGPAEKTLTVTMTGGQYSGKNVTVIDQPIIARGQTRLLYLEKVTGKNKWIPVNTGLGWQTPTGSKSFTSNDGVVRTEAELKNLVK
jgi:hypothetical protein